jgi:hypothetical protein
MHTISRRGILHQLIYYESTKKMCIEWPGESGDAVGGFGDFVENKSVQTVFFPKTFHFHKNWGRFLIRRFALRLMSQVCGL